MAYYNALEDLTRRYTDSRWRGNRDRIRSIIACYDEDALSTLEAHLQHAKRAIGDTDPDALARVKMVSEGIDYSRRLRGLFAALIRVNTAEEWERYQHLKALTLKYFDSVLTTSWTFAGLPHNCDYLQDALRRLERAIRRPLKE